MSGDTPKTSEEFDNSTGAAKLPSIISGNVSAYILKNADLRWFDARGQNGPSPSDLGDHDPIPAEAVVVVTICAPPGNQQENKEISGK